MASVKLLLFQARRHCLTKYPSHFHSPFSLTSNRSLSSSESDPPRRPFEPIPIQPVSYPVKPKDSSPPDSQPSSDAPSLSQPPPPHPRLADAPEQRGAWTREDIRYVKDGQSVSPVVYPTRVAPLPDDRDGNEELERERMKIDAEDQLRKGIAKAAEEEKMKVPFPLLIKPKKNEKPPVYDLAEAIRQVKVRYY